MRYGGDINILMVVLVEVHIFFLGVCVEIYGTNRGDFSLFDAITTPVRDRSKSNGGEAN